MPRCAVCVCVCVTSLSLGHCRPKVPCAVLWSRSVQLVGRPGAMSGFDLNAFVLFMRWHDKRTKHNTYKQIIGLAASSIHSSEVQSLGPRGWMERFRIQGYVRRLWCTEHPRCLFLAGRLWICSISHHQNYPTPIDAL